MLKHCDCCRALCDSAADTCAFCGEASWSIVDNESPSPSSAAPTAPETRSSRRRGSDK